jgi:hypothetical protein
MITIIQVLILIFALFAWSRVALRLKDKSIRIWEFVFWSAIWIGVIAFAVTPAFFAWFSTLLGIGRATDLAMYISIVLLFYLVFRLYVHLEKQNMELTELVRETAIKRAKKK